LSRISSVRIPPPIDTEVLEGIIEDVPSRGRSKGDVNVPISLRAIIAEEHLMNGRSAALELAGELGISSSSVSAYANGSTSTASYNTPKSSIVSVVNKARERATKKAAKTLNAALGAITQQKLDYSDADKLSGIAKDMSVIIKNLEKQSDPGNQGNQTPQFVIFAPQFKKEENYDFITVQE
jgi:predicted transcriptional regulator